ncbi:MAG: bifunctional folylpolyglutamate synthase/dihydrofolate synthase [Candidatus Eisenbacteria bacterium]|nr:bifunctional folylpolyglutamate synthase/dihydrofolate synthase [Candidatus Eisenbacteria bacterium]
MRGTEYDRLVGRFYSLQKRGMKFSLDGTRTLLKTVGRPERHFPSVLVAGTNGKGSTCSLIASILKAAGYNVGLYTSPHLIDFRERIRISGECIARNEAGELLRFLVPIAEKGGHSFFETITALAFKHFKDTKVELVVAEVGLGGRLDSTNVLSPLVSIITGIAVEHSSILGTTLRAIAAEKAGIMRKGRPVVTGARGEALEALAEISTSLASPLSVVGRDIRLRSRFVSRAGTVFSATASSARRSPTRRGPQPGNVHAADGCEYKTRWTDLYLRLRGKRQIRNAGCALLACSHLENRGITIGKEAIEAGLRDAEWPGRLEERGWKPLVLLDVAHNPDAGNALSEALATIYRGKNVVAVVGMVQDKDHKTFLKRLLPRVRHVVFTQASTPRALPACELKSKGPSTFSKWSVKDSVPRALDEAFSLAGDDELVCVTGSFYTVGEAMDCLGIGVRECI